MIIRHLRFARPWPFLLCLLFSQTAPGSPFDLHFSLPLSKYAACPRPELLQASQITDSTALLTWTDVGDQYELELVTGSQAFSGIPTQTINGNPPLQLNGLEPGQNYRFQVRVVCPDGTRSEWSVPKSFATDINNARPCPLLFDLRDTSCNSGGQFFKVHVDDVPGVSLGNDVVLRGIRLMVEHPWRSDLRIWLQSPDGTRIQLIGGLNAGDKNIGDPAGDPCAQFVELTELPGALPLSEAAEQDNFTGNYLPLESLAPFSNGQNPKGIWQLEICDSKTNDKGKLRLFGLVFAPAGCPEVEGLSINNVAETSAALSWISGISGDSIVIEYGPAGFYPGTGSEVGAGGTVILLQEPATQPLLLEGLATLVNYDVYLRRLCAPGVWGPNAPAVHFFTNCTPTLLEDSDTLNTCPPGCADACPLPGLWQNVPDDDYEWKVWTGTGLTYPVAGPPSAPGGSGNYLYFRNSCSPTGANGKKAILRTLCVQVNAPASASCHFSFDLYMNTKTGLMSSLTLQASVDGGQNWQTVKTWSGNRGKAWRREYVDLNAYDGQIALFQLVATGVFGAYGDIAIDNLAFYGSTEAGTPDYTYYRDSDGDGFGDPNQRVTLCSPDIPPGYVLIDSDCNDADSTIYPGAPEILCNQKDENCNGMSDDSTIDAPTGQGDELCAGETATLLANGTPAGQFYWFAGPQSAVPLASGTQLILNGLTGSGTYYLADSISSANGGCSSPRIPVQVIVHPAPNIAAANAPGICQGQSVDLNAIAVTDSAGTGGMLSWHFAYPPNAGNIATSPVQPSVSATFYAQVLADYGCFDVDSVFIAVHPNPAVQIAQGDSISICRGKTITLNATGQGTAPLSYAWSNGLNFPNIPVAASPVPGTTNAYTVTVTDANGCQSLDFIQVHTLNNVTQTAIENIHHPSVCGGTDGSITLHPLNGVPPYAFAWSGPTSGTMGGIGGAATITGLKQGGYRVTVTDATSGCSMVLPQIVLSAPGLSVSIDTIIGNRCPGEENGSIALNVSGTSPAYLWSNGQTTSSIDDLAGGVYSVTISDGNCTQVIANLEVAEPSPLQIIENGIQQVLCNGAATGAIDIAVFGASPPYIFAWSNGANTEDIGGLTAGGYSVTITDSKDCAFSSDIYSIVQPEPLDVSGPASQQIDCHGENSGSISLTISGGKAPYQIHWNNGATSGNLENLPAGNYQATVTDANGCTRLFSTNITQPTAISIDDISTNDPACVGSTDGDITLTVSGGTGPYHFNWSSGQSGMGMNSIIGLIAGIYAVTIEDALGCIYLQDNIDLDAPQLLTLNLETLQPVSCFGTSNGAITVSVAGAEGALNILWNGQPGGLTLGAIPAGPYLLQISDARGCSIRDSFLLPQPKSPLIATLLSAQNALCSKEPNGSIQVFTSGGTPPYTYHWSNNATTEDLPAIAAGDYTLSVTDANGCTAMLGPVAITEPPALIALPAIQDIPCFGTPTGSIEMAVSGGIPPYSYTWSTGESTPNIYFLPAGNYSVTIIDATGCARILADLPVIDKGAEFSVEIIDYQPVSCPGADDGKIIAMASNGTAPYQFSWSPPVGLHANVPSPVDQATGLSGGVYAVTLTDAAGCSAVSLDLLIEEAPQVFFSVVSKTDVLCKGDSTGNVTISLSGGLPPNSFLWSNGANTPDLSGVPAGTYSLTVTDFLNCTLVSTPVTISQPAAVLQITVDSILQDRCGQDQGAVFLKVKGGTFPYQYTWSNGPQTANITGLAAGTYQLTATDHVGCKVVSPVFEIQALATPLGITSNVTPVKCFGDSSGAISVMASGGTPDYSYFWNNGQAGPMIGQLPAGTYMLTLTDEAGCTDVFNFPVSQPASPLVAIAQIDSLSGGWTISLDISGGTGAYEVLWDAGAGGQTGPEVSGLEPGHYTATITDDNGCVLVLNIFAGVTGTDQPSLVRAIRLYPNPSTGPASLDLDLYENTGFVWSILDGTGRLVQTELVEEKSTHHRISIDLNGRPEGLYFVKITLPAGEMRSLPLVKTGK